MKMLLFAANKFYPKGGVDDLIGVFETKLSDQEVLEAVMANVDRYGNEKRLYVSDILVNAVLLEGVTPGERFFWELRFAESLDDKSLDFASVKTVVTDLGPCGLIPLTREDDDLEYRTLDPEKSERY